MQSHELATLILNIFIKNKGQQFYKSTTLHFLPKTKFHDDKETILENIVKIQNMLHLRQLRNSYNMYNTHLYKGLKL